MKVFRLLILGCAVIVSVPLARGQVDGFRVEHTTAVGSTGPVVINDLFIDFDGRYSGSQVLVSLVSGMINQETLFEADSDIAVSQETLAAFPELTADSYFTHGGYAGQELYGSPIFPGGPVNLDPAQATRVETSTDLAATWLAPPGVPIEDQDDLHVLRLALSKDAAGTFDYFASADREFFYARGGGSVFGMPVLEIVNGMLVSTDVSFSRTGDYNGSGQVEQGDLDLVLLNWGLFAEVAGVPAGWVNDPPSGQIQADELDPVLLNWGRTEFESEAVAALPEPGAFGLLALLALTTGRRRGGLV